VPIFDRTEEGYAPIAVLLTPAEQDLLEQALRTPEGYPVAAESWEKAIDEFCARWNEGSGLRAKLRIAVWMWNGQIRLTYEDPRHLDPENRARFVGAMTVWLDIVLKEDLG